jgi:hypothetical protein
MRLKSFMSLQPSDVKISAQRYAGVLRSPESGYLLWQAGLSVKGLGCAQTPKFDLRVEIFASI